MNDLLAKSSGESLSLHTKRCLDAAQSIIKTLPFPDDQIKTIETDLLLAVALHDVGKAATGFQEVVTGKKANWNGKRHEIISASFASNIDGIRPATIFAILTHHKSIPSDGISEIYGCLPREQIPLPYEQYFVWNEMAKEWKDNYNLFLSEWKIICEYLQWDPLKSQNDLPPLSLNQAWLKRTIGRSGQRKVIPFNDRYYASLIRGLTISADHLGSANVIPPSIPDLKFFSILNSPRPFQNVIGNISGSVILRAPTGSGKTEAALLWAQKNQSRNGRLFYILPYTASINAMHNRLSKIFGNKNVGLLHHNAITHLYTMLESDGDLTSLLTKQQDARTLTQIAHELYFPIKVCTPHQILRHTLRGKGWENMLIEFNNACFIFDEIHAYDPRIVGMTMSSVKLLQKMNSKILFMSATLPQFIHQIIIDAMDEEVTFIEPDLEKERDREILNKKRHHISIKDGTINDYYDIIIESIKRCSSTLIVCNHVKTAQYVYRKIQSSLPNESVILLHSRFNREDRNRIESQLIGKKPLPKVMVATQVVEVSLDVDFEQGFFEIAPIDAIIQRMGRVNRSGNRTPANIEIFTKQLQNYNIYCECTGNYHNKSCKISRTINELQNLANPISESDLVNAADTVYGAGYQGKDLTKFEEGFNHPDICKFNDLLLAGAFQDWVDKIIEKTDGLIEVLPHNLLDEYERRKKMGLWIEANNLLVPIRTFSLNKYSIEKKDEIWVINTEYSSNEGLIDNER